MFGPGARMARARKPSAEDDAHLEELVREALRRQPDAFRALCRYVHVATTTPASRPPPRRPSTPSPKITRRG
jgi:hypothetical protein